MPAFLPLPWRPAPAPDLSSGEFELNDRLVQAHAARSIVLAQDWQFEEAHTSLRQALTLNPDHQGLLVGAPYFFRDVLGRLFLSHCSTLQ